MEGVLLINVYVKGPGITNHTQLHKTFTKEKKLVEKERQQKIDLMGILSQEITCRYHMDEDSKVSMVSNESAFSFATLIKLYYEA